MVIPIFVTNIMDYLHALEFPFAGATGKLSIGLPGSLTVSSIGGTGKFPKVNG